MMTIINLSLLFLSQCLYTEAWSSVGVAGRSIIPSQHHGSHHHHHPSSVLSAATNDDEENDNDNDNDDDTTTIHTGTVKWFNTLKGFGFILPDEEHMPDVFVHQTEIYAEGYRSLMDGEPVEYLLARDDRNRYKAVRVTGPQGARVAGAPFRPSQDFDSF